jgi:hypothetical protein
MAQTDTLRGLEQHCKLEAAFGQSQAEPQALSGCVELLYRHAFTSACIPESTNGGYHRYCTPAGYRKDLLPSYL